MKLAIETLDQRTYLSADTAVLETVDSSEQTPIAHAELYSETQGPHILSSNADGSFQCPVQPTGLFGNHIATSGNMDGVGWADIAPIIQDGAAFDAVVCRANEDGMDGITSADFDADGDLDIAATSREGDSVWVLLNGGVDDGTGYRLPVDMEAYAFEQFDAPSMLATGDVDGDGHLDLIVSNEGSGELSILYGGYGSFDEPENYKVDGLSSYGSDSLLELARSMAEYPLPDSNSDGRFDQLDLVLALQSGKYMTGQPAEFSEGDWNSDGSFDTLDVVFALRSDGYLA